MLCGQTIACGCAFQSSSLVLSGSGQPGDPLVMETTGPGIVSTSADVTDPFPGQTIIETATERLKYYNGSAWVIYGGAWPAVNIARRPPDVVISVPNITGTDVSMPSELEDTDSFHASNNNFITIPTGLGGAYMVTFGFRYTSNATGYRMAQLAVGNNSPVSAAEVTPFMVGGYQSIGTVNNAYSAAKRMRLAAAATLTFTTFQSSGGNLDLTMAYLTATLLRHEPALA